MENNNESLIIPDSTKFEEAPVNQAASTEINNIGVNIRNQAKSSLLGSSQGLFGLNLNNITSQNQPTKIALNKFDVGRDAFVELSSGKLIPRFEKYMPGVDNEELLAASQSSGDKWANAIPKFLGKTLVNVAGGTIGTVEGLINGIQMQSLSAVYDSDFNNYLEDLNKELDYKLPNYYTQQERDMNFGQKLGTANFWANDFLGGVSFLAGTIISEGLWAAATGGTSLIAKGAVGGFTRILSKNMGGKAAAALTKSKATGNSILRAGAKSNVEELTKAGIKASKITKGLNTARFLYTSAGFEAGVEARHFMAEALEEWKIQFRDQNGRNPNAKEIGEFKDSSTSVGNGLFAANVALVGTSNLTILGKLFLNKAPTKAISTNIFKKTAFGVGFKKVKEGGVKAVSANKAQKIFGRIYGIGKPAITEGFIEEGGQAVMSTAASDYVLSAYDKNNLNDGLSLSQSLMNGFNYAYGTKQGLTEVGLGSLIGILGGGIATRGRFNEVSAERKQVEQSVKYINQFHQGNLVETIKYNAKTRAATLAGEKAKEEGNLTNEMRADMSAMTALAERAYHYENKQDTIDNMWASIDAMDTAELEKLGLSKEEITEWKSDKKSEFKNVMDLHTKNLEFAEVIVGGTPIAGLENIKGLDEKGRGDLKGAIAYSLTMGTKSDEFAEALAIQIKALVTKDLSSGQEIDAINVNEVIRKISASKKLKYDDVAAKYKLIQKKLIALTKAKVEADTVEQVGDPEANKKLAARRNKITLELLKLQEESSRLEGEKSQAFEALNIPQLSDEVITEEMLDNQATNVKRLADVVAEVGLRDPIAGEMLEKLHKEYDRAVQNTKTFNATVHAITNPKTRVSTLSGWLGSLINKNKKVGEDTAEYFIKVIEQFQSLGQGRNEIIISKKLVEEIIEEDNSKPLDNAPEDITEEINKSTEVTTNPTPAKDIIAILTAKINEIIHRDPYTNLEYQGEDFTYEEAAPTQKEVDRYNELLGKITKGKRISTILINGFNTRNNVGLTKGEVSELQSLNDKLNNWKVLTGVGNENNDSIAEILQLINQLENEYKLTPTKTKVGVNELPTSEQSKSGVSNDALSTVVTPDIPVAKKLSSGNVYSISHMEPKTLLEVFPGSKVFVEINDKSTDIETIPASKLQELQKEAGTKFTLVTESGEKLGVEIGERQQLVINIEALDSVISESNIRILDFGNSSFMPIFIKSGDTFVPMRGDFTIESIDDNELIVLDSERLYELTPEDFLRTVVNLNDSYNSKLIKDFKEGKITKKELINNINIYIVPQGELNSIVGTLRAIKPSSNPNSEVFSKLYTIRKQAVDKALKSKTNRVEIGITIPMKLVLIGSPNISVTEENGKVTPIDKPLTQEALEMVDDYGYMLNGEIFTNKNLEYTDKDTIFATAVSKRADNKNKKVPVIVFKHKNRTVVYPVSLKETTGTKADTVVGILNKSQFSDTAKVLEINEFLAANNINPKQYGIYDLETTDSIDEVHRLLADLGNINDVIDVNTWLTSEHEKIQLLNAVGVSIDITNKPFNAPKGVLDFQGIRIPNEQDLEIESINTLDNLAKKVDKIFDKDNPFANMRDNWAFFDAFEEEGIVKDADNFIMKRKNTNTLRNAFNENIPKRVREVLGTELIKEVRAELKVYKLLSEGVKSNMKAINTKLKEELNSIENNCK